MGFHCLLKSSGQCETQITCATSNWTSRNMQKEMKCVALKCKHYPTSHQNPTPSEQGCWQMENSRTIFKCLWDTAVYRSVLISVDSVFKCGHLDSERCPWGLWSGIRDKDGKRSRWQIKARSGSVLIWSLPAQIKLLFLKGTQSIEELSLNGNTFLMKESVSLSVFITWRGEKCMRIAWKSVHWLHTKIKKRCK